MGLVVYYPDIRKNLSEVQQQPGICSCVPESLLSAQNKFTHMAACSGNRWGCQASCYRVADENLARSKSARSLSVDYTILHK